MGLSSFIGTSTVALPRFVCPPATVSVSRFHEFEQSLKRGDKGPTRRGGGDLGARAQLERVTSHDKCARHARLARRARRAMVPRPRFLELRALNFEFPIASVAQSGN